MRGKIALVILAVAQSGTALAQSVIEAVPDRPRIVVTGFGEVKSAPDIATINYTIRGEGSVSDDAVRAMVATGAKIEDALRAVDSTAEPRTSQVQIAAVKSPDCKEQSYGGRQLSTGACAITGYVATQSITLRTGAVKEAGTVVGLIGRAGGVDPRISGFTLRDSRPIQQQAIAAAVANAATMAAGIAAASHVQLGQILSVTSGPRNDFQQIVISGSRIAAPPPPPPPPPPVMVNVTPEPLTTTSYVTVTYAIGR
jgi:uncharacterized protein YggE